MLSFFEMFHLMEGIADLRRKFGMPPPASGIVPHRDSHLDVDDPSVDPNALKGQGTGQIRQNKSISKRLGDNWRGPQAMGLPVTDREGMLNRAARMASRAPEDVSYNNLVGQLTARGRSFAADVLKAILGNRLLLKGGKFDFRQLATALNMADYLQSPNMIAQLKEALQAISNLPGSPLSLRADVGFGGRRIAVYKLSRQGSYSDPEEDQRALNPYGRQLNPARKGGAARTVGTPESLPEAPPADPAFAHANLNPNLRSKEAPLGAEETGKLLDSLANRFVDEHERVMDNLHRYTPEQINERPQLAHANLSGIKDEFRAAVDKLKHIAKTGGPDQDLAQQRLQAAADEWEHLEALEQEYDQAISGIEAGPRREWRYYHVA